MIRSKKFFAIGSIVSMATLFISILTGFVQDARHYSYYFSYYYYDYRSSTYYTSFAEEYVVLFVLFCALAVFYIAFSIVAIILYNKRIMAINIINIVQTLFFDLIAFVIVIVALTAENFVFALFLTLFGFVVPFHLVVEVFALIPQRKKKIQEEPSCESQEPVFEEVSVQTPDSDTIEALNQYNALYDAGVLTEDEYNEKRKKFVEKI